MVHFADNTRKEGGRPASRGERFRTGLRHTGPVPSAPAGGDVPARGETFRALLDALPAVRLPPGRAAQTPPRVAAQRPRSPQSGLPRTPGTSASKAAPRPTSRKRPSAPIPAEAASPAPVPKKDARSRPRRPETTVKTSPPPGAPQVYQKVEKQLASIFDGTEAPQAPAAPSEAPASPSGNADAPAAPPESAEASDGKDFKSIENALQGIFHDGEEEADAPLGCRLPGREEEDDPGRSAPAEEDGEGAEAEGEGGGEREGRTVDLPDFVSRVMQEFDSRLLRNAELSETTEMGSDEMSAGSGEMEIEQPRKSGNAAPRKEIEALKDLFTDE